MQLTESQMIEFENRFSAAAAFVRACELRNERKSLAAECNWLTALADRGCQLTTDNAKRMAWVKMRLEEMRLIFG